MVFWYAMAALVAYFYLPGFLRLLYSKCRQWYMIRNLPGPKRPFFIGTFGDMIESSQESLKFLMREADKLRREGVSLLVGVCLGRVYVIPLDGSMAKYILESTTEIDKGHDYDFLTPWLEQGLLLSKGEKWRMRRKLITPTFHFQQLLGYVGKMNSNSRHLVDVLRQRHLNQFVDLYGYIKCVSLDIACETIFGIYLDTVSEPDQPYMHAVDEFIGWAARYTIEFWMWFPPTWFLFYSRRYNQLLKTMRSFTEEVIRKRIEARKRGDVVYGEGEGKTRKIILDQMLDLHDEGALSIEDVREEVDTLMFGGHDTTSCSMNWYLWCLATHPEIQEKVYEEVHDIFGDSDRDCTVEDMKEMYYLDQTLKEASRLYPTSCFLERKLREDFKFGEYLVPKDADVFITPPIIHHNPVVYGENHWEFNPDNFLPENAEKRRAHDYIPFSAGPRNCIGQKFAYNEMKCILSWILRSFELKTDRKMDSNEWLPEIILKPKDGCPVTLLPRKPRK